MPNAFQTALALAAAPTFARYPRKGIHPADERFARLLERAGRPRAATAHRERAERLARG